MTVYLFYSISSFAINNLQLYDRSQFEWRNLTKLPDQHFCIFANYKWMRVTCFGLKMCFKEPLLLQHLNFSFLFHIDFCGWSDIDKIQFRFDYSLFKPWLKQIFEATQKKITKLPSIRIALRIKEQFIQNFQTLFLRSWKMKICIKEAFSPHCRYIWQRLAGKVRCKL